MTGTSNGLAVRESTAAAYQDAALSIRPGQTTWDEFQNAALNQLGLKNASNADRAVFLHQCQRTGLDPFAKQIMMIERREKRGNDWVSKWTIQTGIEGWRTIRDRAERREGVRGILSRFTYYDHEDNERKVWTRPEPPAAVEVTYTVRDRNGVETPYTSVLRYDEYVQTKEINGQHVPIAQWATKKVHMTEKCTEADVYRKTFPQDYAGIELSDAMPPAEDLPPLQPARQRVTAADARARNPQTVTAVAEVVTPDVPPAGQQAPPVPGSEPPAEQPAGGTPNRATSGQVGLVQRQLERLGVTDRTAKLRIVGLIAGRPVESSKELTDDEARKVKDTLEGLADGAALDGLRAELAMADDPRDEADSVE